MSEWKQAFSAILTLGMLALTGPAVAQQDAPQSQPKTPQVSQFIDQLEKQHYPQAEAPAGPKQLRWDFSRQRVYTYGYQQKASTAMDAARAGEQSMELQGRLQVKSQGDGTARLVLDQLEAKMLFGGADDGEDSNGPRTMKRQMPSIVLSGMSEDGRVQAKGGSQKMLMKILFPLPDKALAPGGTADVPLSMPFNAMGSPLTVKGQSRITLTDYVTIDGKRCARLKTRMDIDKLDVPEELEGEYQAQAHGQGVFYFSPAQHRFVRGSLAVRMDMSIDAPMPQAAGGDGPERAKTAMTYDTLIRIRPEKEKDNQAEDAKQ
jgi:hypothetical protein